MGFFLEWELGQVAGWNNGKTMFWITQADKKGMAHPHHTGDIGFHHYAFELRRRADVDDLYEFLKKEKAKVVDPPADYPTYGEGYYAVFFLDPGRAQARGHVSSSRSRKKRARKKRKMKSSAQARGAFFPNSPHSPLRRALVFASLTHR